MKTPADLQSFFEQELRSDLQSLEAARIKVATRIKILALIMAVLLLGCGGLVFVMEVFAAIPAILVVIVWALVAWRLSKGYTSEFKTKVIARIVKFIDPGLDYQPAAGIAMNDYLASGIFRTRPDRYRGDDLVAGTLGKTKIAFSELHSEYKTTSHSSSGGTQTHWHTIFKGLFFIADFNKQFKGETFVLPDLAQRTFGNVLGNLFQSWNKARGQLIKMEDPRFEKQFVVYGADQIEARYILSTSLMNRISDYRERTGKNIYLSFVNHRINVAITYYKNLFEPKLFKTLLDFGTIREYYEDLAYAVSLVDDLNLNTRIWN